MTNDKLNNARGQSTRALNILTVNDKPSAFDALDDAIRARLMHVAVGVIGMGGIGSVVRMLVDLSVHVSLHETKLRKHGSVAHGLIMLHGGDAQAPAYDFNATICEDAHMVVPKWSYVATRTPLSNVPPMDLAPTLGEPMTLRLLFDAETSCGTSQIAEQLCSRFSAWNTATTSLKQAMEAIHTTLIIPAAYPAASCERMIYRSASVCKGWHDRIVDPVHFLHSSFEGDAWPEPRLTAPIAALCKERVEAAWHETAKAFAVREPLSDDAGESADGDSADLATSTDAADDFVRADRMASLWYGNKRRPHRRR